MTYKLSTRMRNKMLDTGSLKSILDGGKINIYAGAVPATADAALDSSNVLLVAITLDAAPTGITFAAAAGDGIIQKNGVEIWRGVCTGTGTATFYRHVAAGDTGVLSTVEPRLQGEVAQFGSELNLSNTSLVVGASQSVGFYSVNLPTL